MEDSEENDTLYVGNLSPEVTEEILYELFLQVGPLVRVYKPKDRITQVSKNFAFIQFKDTCSVPYAMDVMEGTKLYDRELRLSLPRNRKQGQLSSKINEERSFLIHNKNYGNDSANDYMNVSNYHNSQYFNEDEHRNFRRHGSHINIDNRNNPLPNIPFSKGSQKDFPFHLDEQLLNQVPFLPSTLDSPYYASQGGTYLGGTHVTQGQGGKSHKKKHGSHKNYPHTSEKSREKDSNHDRHRHHHHHRHH